VSNISHVQDPQKLTLEDAKSVPTWRAAYSDRTAWLMSVFSQLAYVPFVDDQSHPGKGNPKAMQGDGWAELDPYLKDGGFEVRATFNKGDVQSFLAVNPEQLAVLAFRGTANWADWKINLNAVRIPMPGYPAVHVHEGFWQAFEDSVDDIRKAVGEHVPDDLGLYITGHSLGGALAQVASVVLERDNLAANYTFGSPRVASRGFDKWVKCPHYRLVNHWDLVPGVPLPGPWWGYRHSGDPRLLLNAKPTIELRGDQNVFLRLLVTLGSVVQSLGTHTIFAVDDHMIWNYRDQLRSFAEARARPGEQRPGSGVQA
jgi:hypothetical protein